MSITAVIAVGLFAAGLPFSAIPDSHCRADESIAFSCSFGKKMVSLCSSKNASETSGYLQYRYGAKTAVELEYPNSPSHPKNKFALNRLTPLNDDGTRSRIIEISFRNGDVTYTIVSFGMGDSEEVKLEVSRNATSIAEMTCINESIVNFDLSHFEILEKFGLGDTESPAVSVETDADALAAQQDLDTLSAYSPQQESPATPISKEQTPISATAVAPLNLADMPKAESPPPSVPNDRVPESLEKIIQAHMRIRKGYKKTYIQCDYLSDYSGTEKYELVKREYGLDAPFPSGASDACVSSYSRVRWINIIHTISIAACTRAQAHSPASQRPGEHRDDPAITEAIMTSTDNQVANELRRLESECGSYPSYIATVKHLAETTNQLAATIASNTLEQITPMWHEREARNEAKSEHERKQELEREQQRTNELARCSSLKNDFQNDQAGTALAGLQILEGSYNCGNNVVLFVCQNQMQLAQNVCPLRASQSQMALCLRLMMNRCSL